MRVTDALSGTMASPVRTLHRMTREGVAVWPPLALMVLVTAFVHAKPLVRLVMVFETGPMIVLRRMRDIFVDALRVDVTVILAVAAMAAALAHLLARGRMLPSRAAAAAVWLCIPLVVLKAVGGILEASGLDVWWLPHHAVDSWAVFVNRQVSGWRIALKCASAYGVLCAVFCVLVMRFRGTASIFSEIPMRRGRAALVFLTTLLLVLAGTETWSSVRAFQRLRPTLVGDPLPDASLRVLSDTGLTTRRLALSQFQGRVVMLDFWASWCTPCRRSMPEISRLAQELSERGFVVVGINREPWDVAAAARAVAELRPSFETVVDERGYGDRLGLTSLPSSYLVDRRGHVRHIHLGYTSADVLRREVEALLGEDTPAGDPVAQASPP